jgi:rare lipoprotein A
MGRFYSTRAMSLAVAAASMLFMLGIAVVLVADERPRSRPPVQHGLASYYAAGFQGDRTASGVRFDQRALVAAHRSLPMGTIVRVTNVENGRAVTVKIVDRGPFGRNRRKGTVIDLSRAAARRLGMLRDGLVRVRIRVLKTAPLQ